MQPAALAARARRPDAQGAGRQPAARAALVHLDQPDGRAVRQLDCRKAIEYAADRVGYQTAYGGPFAGGDIATTLLPPPIPGYQKFDLYPAGADNKGDLDQGQGGADRVRQAERLRDQHRLPGRAAEGEGGRRGAAAGLAKVGIKLTLKALPHEDYFALYAGKPPTS